MSDVNKELLAALKELLIDMTLAQNNMRQAALYDAKWGGCAEAIQPRVDAARKAVEEAEKEQQSIPVATVVEYCNKTKSISWRDRDLYGIPHGTVLYAQKGIRE